jgi:phosphate:Na+ symporter
MEFFSLLLRVLGGLAIFVYGMKMMGDGLHAVAGEKMRSILRLFSANRFVAILSGAAVTAVI